MSVVNCRNKSLLLLAHCGVCVIFGAEPKPQSPIQQSTPAINVSVCSFHGLPSWVLEGAESEAARIFRQAAITMKWLDCDPEKDSVSRELAASPAELLVRVVPHALSPASKTALAMAFPFPGSTGTAFIFYDRVVAMQTSGSLLQTMLGRVVVHEIIHLLLPGQEHSRSGLMRRDWSQEDLRFSCRTVEILSSDLVVRLHRRQALASQLRTVQITSASVRSASVRGN
jgi:hypothetical protein